MKNQKGITLIALVITIIVMLILVGVSVTVALNGGLFSSAQQAATETANKRNEELNLSDGKVEINGEWYNSIEEYVENGVAWNKEYETGEEVIIGNEHFYVIAESKNTVTLLAKENINTTTLLQDPNVDPYTNRSPFIKSGAQPYWNGAGDIVEPEATLDETTGKLTLPENNLAAKAAYDYGRDLGGKGRLMTKKEVEDLLAMNNTDITDIIYGKNGKSSSDLESYWLATAFDTNYVWYVNNGVDEIQYNNYNYPFICVRPVVEISKSAL